MTGHKKRNFHAPPKVPSEDLVAPDRFYRYEGNPLGIK